MSALQWCPYLLSLCFVAFLAGWKRNLVGRLSVIAIELAGVAESIIAIRQVLGLSLSNHSLYSLTGSFDNPGPLGGFLAVSAAVAVCDAAGNYQKLSNPFKAAGRDVPQVLMSWFSAISATLCLVVLPAMMSRAGWIALSLAVCFFFLGTSPVKAFLAKHRWALPAGALLLALLAMGAFLLKPESALGRIHIWHMELLAFLEKPLTGWGFGREMGAYGAVQHDYFASGARAPWETAVAGCPEYPFNEYLGLAVGGGLLALILVLLLLVLGLRRLKGSPLKYGLIVFAVFSFASYPMSSPLFRVTLAILLGFALAPRRSFSKVHWIWAIAVLSSVVGTIPSLREQRAISEAGKTVRLLSFSKSGRYYNGTAARLGEYYDVLKKDFRFLYEYGLALNKEGKYAESNEVLVKGVSLSSDPMFHNIMGKNYQQMGDYVNAEEELRYSSFQVPSRLYPHVLLMELYLSQGDDVSACNEAEAILSMRVNSRNRNMTALREQALAIRDSLTAIHRFETPRP